MPIQVIPIQSDDVLSFRDCLDAVARERRFLAMLEAPSLEQMREFVGDNIARGVAQVVAKDADRVVGWCDILPRSHPALAHCGSLGMGLLASYRGRGLGRALLEACLQQARRAGITRVELEARSDNAPALRLYTRMGFEVEGTRRHGMKVDGKYIDTVAMALLFEAAA